MRKTLLVAALILIGVAAQAQTEKELIGKWKMVHIVKREEVPVEDMYGAKEVYQVFSEEGNRFTTTLDGKEAGRGTFRMSDDNKTLILKLFLEDGTEVEKSSRIQFSDANNRTATVDIKGVVGTLSISFEKVE